MILIIAVLDFKNNKVQFFGILYGMVCSKVVVYLRVYHKLPV